MNDEKPARERWRRGRENIPGRTVSVKDQKELDVLEESIGGSVLHNRGGQGSEHGRTP